MPIGEVDIALSLLAAQKLRSPLWREWEAAQRALDDEMRAALDIVPPEAVDGFVGAARVRLCAGRLYEPDAARFWAYVTPITYHRLRVFDFLVGLGVAGSVASEYAVEIVDLLAWLPQPGAWALRRGVAHVLGVPGTDATRVWREPWGWLRAGCVGLCPLSARLALEPGRRYVAEDRAHAQELREGMPVVVW